MNMKKSLKLGVPLCIAALLALTLTLCLGAEAPTPTLTVQSQNLSYSDSVYMLYAVSHTGFDRETNEIEMLFWSTPQKEYLLGTEEYRVSNSGKATVKGEDCLVFYSDGIAAKKMTDEIYARAAVTVSGTTYYSDVVRISVLEYVALMREKGNLDPALDSLFDQMLDYGAAAQEAFGYKTDRPANGTFYRVSAVGGTLENGFDTGLVLDGKTATLTAPATSNAQYFSHWADESGNSISEEESVTVTVAGKNATYTAIYVSDCSHSYDTKITVAPTTFGEGKAIHVCSRCTHTYTEVLPATKSLKLLAVGNSFSQDAMEHLYIICKDAGIEEIVLGHLYIGGCSLERHLTEMTDQTTAYTFYLSNDATSSMVSKGSQTAKYGLTYTDWDFVTIQQASPVSGIQDSYSYLDGVVDYINAYKPSDAKLLWHMTWAYQSDSTKTGFSNYNKDQLTMYHAIVSAVQAKIVGNDDFDGIIPSGTAIQNLRTSHLGDTLTRDGYHMSYGMGRYTVSMTWLAYITGCDISGINAVPSSYPEIAEHLDCIKESVKNAVATPFSVTPSTFTDPIEEDTPVYEGPLTPDVAPLTEDDRAFLEANGLDPDRYLALDLGWIANAYYNSSTSLTVVKPADSSDGQWQKFLATPLFTEKDLVNGTVLRIKSGYQYRPEGFIDATTKNNKNDRPGNVTTEMVTVDDAWWGDFTLRGFNLSKTKGTITIDECDALRIYVPIAKRAQLSDADRQYLSGKGLNPDEYMVLDAERVLHAYFNSATTNGYMGVADKASLAPKYYRLEMLTRYDLTEGSVIRMDGSYAYRPDGWISWAQQNASTDRPAEVSTAYTVITPEWWADFAYRGINVKKSSTVSEADYANFVIYVKTA